MMNENQNTTYNVSSRALEFISSGPKLLLIDGQWVLAVSGKFIDTVNPATGELLAKIAEAGYADVDLAVKAAQKAFSDLSWSNITPHERGNYLLKIAGLIESNADELATIESLDQGMPTSLAKHLVAGAVQTFRYYAGWPTKVYGKTNPSDQHNFNYTLREPLGVCGSIIPWNGPIFMSTWKIAPALAFGNTVIIKPSELTTLSVLRLGELIMEAGVPPGVVNILPGYGKIVGQALVEHPGIRKIAFTGSTEVGKHILRSSVESLKKVTLELGGKSPNIIFADADLEKAVEFAVKGFATGSGQGCVLTTRVLIQQEIYDEISAKIVAIVEKLKIGSGQDPDTDIGPINNADQFKKIVSYFKIAEEDGATLATGGEIIEGKGFFVKPTVYTHVKNEMRIAQEEIFGPVVVLIPFKDEEDAIAIGNDIQYGLGAAIWTNDINKALRVSRAIKAGTVWINTLNILDPITPFGGYKQSGIGRELGEESLDTYTQVKSVIINY